MQTMRAIGNVAQTLRRRFPPRVTHAWKVRATGPALAPGARMEAKTVYSFGGGRADGGRELRELLGGKGAHLGEMARLGLPIPPGFTVSTAVCREFSSTGTLPPAVAAEIDAALAGLEEAAGLTLGDPAAPLLLSVRSGARVSMPGMMDTVLDLGLNDQTVEGLAKRAG